MMLDNETILSDDQAITATAISEDVYDQGEGLGNLGAGQPLTFGAVFTESFNNLTSLEVQLVAADSADLATNPIVIDSSTVTLANAEVGKRIAGTANVHAPKRYIGFNYVVSGTAPTTGKVKSFINLDLNVDNAYPANYDVQTN